MLPGYRSCVPCLGTQKTFMVCLSPKTCDSGFWAAFTNCLITSVWLLLLPPFQLPHPGIITLIVPGCFLNVYVFPKTGNMRCSRLPSGTGKMRYFVSLSHPLKHTGGTLSLTLPTHCPPPLNAQSLPPRPMIKNENSAWGWVSPLWCISWILRIGQMYSVFKFHRDEWPLTLHVYEFKDSRNVHFNWSRVKFWVPIR